MKKTLSLLLFVPLLLSACGVIGKDELGYEVEIVVNAFLEDEGESIESYVENLNSENDGRQYEVYDTEHYKYVITERERLETLEKFSSEEWLTEVRTDYWEYLTQCRIDQSVADYVIRDDYTEMYIYTQNLDLVGTRGDALYFGSQSYWYKILDTVQAYNLVAPEDRMHKVVFVDKDE